MRARLLGLMQDVRASFWLVPALMTLAAALLAFATLAVDKAMQSQIGTQYAWLYGGGADGARGVLSTIAGCAITVASIVFSITIVALTTASNQYSPRVLRTFMEDRATQASLGTFVATFLYALLLLRDVRGRDEGLFVPHLSLAVSVGFAIANLAVLVYFFHHVSAMLQPFNLLERLATELDREIESAYPLPIPPVETKLDAQPPTSAWPVTSLESGYVTVFLPAEVVEAASAANARVWLHAQAGTHVIAGETLAWVDGPEDLHLIEAIRNAYHIAMRRTPDQDLNYAVQRVREIATRALSPAINDPDTAIMVIDRLCASLRRAAQGGDTDVSWHDEGGSCRVQSRGVPFSEIVRGALDPIWQYGHDHPLVANRLRLTVVRLRAADPTGRHQAVLDALEHQFGPDPRASAIRP